MPAISTTFRSGEPPLQDILRDIQVAKMQLPDFQRGWVWDDDHIRSLVASISLSYPIGAVMLLQTGGDGTQFLPRPVEGVVPVNGRKPEVLILDGQQRMTSLYLALMSGRAVPTRTDKGREIERLYYLDIRKCLDPQEDRMDAVISVPAERVITSDFGRKVELDLRTEELEYEQAMFPLATVFDSAGWRRGYQKKFRSDETRLDEWDAFETEVLGRFQAYRVPTIELLRETPREAVCQVFEKVNTGGVTLTVFELMTATFAADSYNLRQDWDARKEILNQHPVLQDFDATSLLTAVTLLASYKRNMGNGSAISCKRKDVLRLSLGDYRANTDAIKDGLVKAARMLAREKIFDTKSLPYSTQLIPLSVICAMLEDRFENETVRNKLTRWFWCGVFGELYGGANESRYTFDVSEVLAWIDGGPEPRTVRDANFAPVRLLSIQTRNSAAYKGLMALLMKAGCRDFLSGDTIELTSYFDLAVDIHHLFPRAHCEKENISSGLWNSSVNKSPLSARTNRIIGGNAPSVYVSNLERNHTLAPAKLDAIVSSHLANPVLLRQDDFTGFLRDRATRLIDLIEHEMGKSVAGRDSQETMVAFGGPLIAANAT